MVIGGGVIGLSTASLLRESGLDVLVRTAAPPPATTSAVAAALWLPYKAYPADRVLAWGQRAYEVFEELARNPEETGARMREGLELWRKPVPDPWWASAVPTWRVEPIRNTLV